MPPSFASVVPDVESAAISPKLGITMAGCVLAFLAITIGFILVARHKRRASRSPAQTQTHTPSKHHHCPNRHPSTRRGISLPVASSGRCPVCSPSGDSFGVSRASYESLHSIVAPLPPYTRYAPTGASAIRPEVWRSRAVSSSPPVSPASPATPTAPPSPPPAYMARGPTASFHRAVN